MNLLADGRDVLIAFSGDVGEVSGNSLTTDYEEEGSILTETANIFRR